MISNIHEMPNPRGCTNIMAALSPLLCSLLAKCDTSLSDILPHVGGLSPSDVLTCSIQCLNLFVQFNWTGPPNEGAESQLETLLGQTGVRALNSNALTQLSADGEAVHRLCHMPLLLCVAKLLLVSLSEGDPLLVKHWTLRCLFVQQRLLESRSASLWHVLRGVVTELGTLADTGSLTQGEQCELYLELGHVSLYYLQYESAKIYFERALQVASVSTELVGALGKRTRFQQTDVAQLTLKVSTSIPDSAHSPDSTHKACSADPKEERGVECPREISLDDDTILDRISFAQPQSLQCLSSLQQAALLGWCIHQKRTKAVDQLSAEEMEAYLNCVLGTAQCWAVQGHALFLRTQLDKQRYKVQQRNMQQLEELVDCFQRAVPEVSTRLKLFYSVPYCPLWVFQKELANVLVKLGCLNSAVEVLTRLQMWEELAVCYVAVGRKAKAKEVVQQQLDVGPTPSLLCLMGDITEDTDCYRQAWELSNMRSSRAQKSLGLWHLKQKEYEACVQCLQKALSINSLQEGLWFSLGCAASQIGQIDLAITAWHREVTLQPDFAEAWNNLGGAYLKKNEKRRAHRIFNEALRCSFDNPKIWENYLVVSADLQLWAETLRAYQRLLDIQDKFLDVEVLTVLVGGVIKGSPEKSLPPACEHRGALGQLLGRVTARGQVPAAVWQLYAQFHLSSTQREDHVKGVQELQKAQRAARLQTGWDKTLEGVRIISQFTLDYCRASRQLYSGDGGVGQAMTTLSSARLVLQGVISKAKSFGVSSSQAIQDVISELEAEMGQLLAITHA